MCHFGLRDWTRVTPKSNVRLNACTTKHVVCSVNVLWNYFSKHTRWTSFGNKCRNATSEKFSTCLELKKSPVLVKQREEGKWTGRDNLLCTRQFAIPRQNCMALLNIKDPFLTVMDNESSNTHVGNCILHFQLFVQRWGPSMNDVSN